MLLLDFRYCSLHFRDINAIDARSNHLFMLTIGALYTNGFFYIYFRAFVFVVVFAFLPNCEFFLIRAPVTSAQRLIRPVHLYTSTEYPIPASVDPHVITNISRLFTYYYCWLTFTNILLCRVRIFTYWYVSMYMHTYMRI